MFSRVRQVIAQKSGISTNQNRMRRGLLLLIMSVVLGLASSVRANKGVYEWAFIDLDYARKEKVQQLRRFCDRIHNLAVRVRNDEVMIKFFDVNNKYHDLVKNGSAPDELRSRIREFRKDLNDYYVDNFLSFYDILFVSRSGDVFHTIRKESDYHSNLFVGECANTPLAEHLRADPRKEVFVDFHYYASSDKPAAFFIEPVQKDGTHIGWFVLQCAINKVNSLFTGAEQLGVTGEAFLVNHKGHMLTESSFEDNSTILKKQLDDRNIQAKFRQKEGRKTVTDYRGFTALTSFEVFDFLGTQWLVVAKVDEAQVITEHFKQHRRYYGDKIAHHLSSLSPEGSNECSTKTDKKIIRVDMDEFVKANHGELLQTIGVSTCTAVIATYPGKFGYMAHISPYDKIYGGSTTNLLGHVIKKVKVYDIPKYERRRMRFVIVAKQLKSLPNIVDKLVDEGFLLSQINVLHHAQARCANVTYDYSNNHTCTEWLFGQHHSRKIVQVASDINNLGTIVKQHVAE